MSSVVLRRLAITCRSASSIYHGRGFATSSPLSTETNSSGNTDTTTTPSSDTTRTITLIPGK
jgi:hypothetical protein